MHSISTFPSFQPLDFDIKGEVNKIVKDYQPYSDFNFISMFSWDVENELSISLLNNNFVVRFQNYITRDPFLSVIGRDSIDETLHTLIKYSEDNSMGSKLYLIPEVVINNISKNKDFKIEEDRDAYDYIVDAKKLAELKGKHYSGKRHGVNKSIRTYSNNLEVRHLRANHKTVTDILQTFAEWKEATKKEEQEIWNELRAVTKLLENADKFDLEIIGVYLSDRMVAFAIYELLPDDFAIGHFEKAIKDNTGLYDFLKQATAMSLHRKGVKFINYEQDLGIEGLRETKLLLHPDTYLRKYTVEEMK